MPFDDAELERNMTMIVLAGDAKTQSLESMDCFLEGKFDKAESLVEAAKKNLKDAHGIHKTILHKVVNGEKVEPDLLLIHAMDHLSSAETCILIAQKMCMMFKNYFNSKEAR
jgi:PTS system cellobiose-specific IIA component